jgi:hypothetical protein
MPRRVVIGLAAVLLVVGVAFGSYLAGWWPGTSSAAAQPGQTFEQSSIVELQQDAGTAAAISKAMAASTDAERDGYREQGHDVVAQACGVAGLIHQIPPDLTDFVHTSCVNGTVSPTSEFATAPGAGNDVPPSGAEDVPD